MTDGCACNKLPGPSNRRQAMQTQLEYPVVTALIDVIADWWRQRDRRRSGLAAVPGSEVERMARDIGVTAAELRALDRRGDQPLLLTRMAAALQIDLQLVARREPDTLRDLER